MSFVSLTVMADLPLSIHSLNRNSIGDKGAMAVSEAVKKMPNLQQLE